MGSGNDLARTGAVRDRQDEHFQRISRRYDDLRTLHEGLVKRVCERVGALPSPLTVVEIGVATGRYLIPISRRIRERGRTLRAIGIDRGLPMLQELRNRADGAWPPAVEPLLADAHHLPLAAGQADVVLCFNAIHHFHLADFLAETARILAPRGMLIVYTRTPEQNARTIWGRFFPDFATRETRLPSEASLRDALRSVGGFQLLEMSPVEHDERAAIEKLIEQARHKHYSTFTFYEERELERAIRLFEERLRRVFAGREVLEFVHENTWLVAERTA